MAHEVVAEGLNINTAFICGYNEHEGCEVANKIVEDIQAEVFLLNYDDQVVTTELVEYVLKWQWHMGGVVSGWQVLGQDSPYASAAYPSWGDAGLALTPECFYLAEDLRSYDHWPMTELLPTVYFAALTAVPRSYLLESPLRALSSWVDGPALQIWPSRDGKPYDKGCCSDWTLAHDMIKCGHRIWIAREAEVKHLAPKHAVPAHKFFIAEDDPAVHWNRRPL